jgi:hypothetical protein
MGRGLGWAGASSALALACLLSPACGGAAPTSDLFGAASDGGGGAGSDGAVSGDACPAGAHCTSPGDGGPRGDGGGCVSSCVPGLCGSDGCGGACVCPGGAACVSGVCGGEPPPDAGFSCAPPTDCTRATDLGAISGDTAGPGVSATGSTSRWLSVLVREDDMGILGVPLTVTATLTPPAGVNFDLFLYMDAAGTPQTRVCNGAPVASSTKTSGVDMATHAWGEQITSNNGDDTRIVSIEVRFVSGLCAPAATWSLTVTGH